jgi:energy-coupling factor transport system ATP-binding protein
VAPLITLHNLRYAYPPPIAGQPLEWALRGVSLEIEAGAFVGLMGHTGSGKSTLCLALNGIVPRLTGGHIGGDVLLDGRPVRDQPVAESARSVGLVFQEPETALFNMTVEAEVAFGLESLALGRVEMAERIEWALALVGLTAERRRPPYQLSGGQKQRLAIAAAVAMRPRLLVLDEPTAHLDPVGKRELLATLAELRQQRGMTILLVEQDSEWLAEYTDRVIILADGQVALDGPAVAILSQAGELGRLGLRPPQVSELAACLNARQRSALVFTRLDEAAAILAAEMAANASGSKPDLQPAANRDALPIVGRVSNPTAGANPANHAPDEANASGSKPDLRLAANRDALPIVARVSNRTPGANPADYAPDEANAPGSKPALRPSTPALEARDIWFTYPGGPPALRGVSLSVAPGELVAVIGQNGSGKTTLARHFNGLLRPQRGQLLLDGRPTAGQSIGALARQAGYLFQNPDQQIFCATTREEIAYGPRNLGLAPAEVGARVAEALSRFGLEAVADRPPATLGYGLRRQVALAAVYALHSPILILDEPTGGLDGRGIAALVALLNELSVAGRTIVLISHDMALVAALAPRCLVMRQGEIVADAPTRDLLGGSEALAAAAVEPPQITRLGARLFPDEPPALTVAELCARLGAPGD